MMRFTLIKCLMMPVVAGLLLGLLAPVAYGVTPESGMYWSPNYPGRGYYIDIQEGMASVTIYAYDEETGQAEIYVAHGEVRDDGTDIGISIRFHPPANTEGYFPLHYFIGDLYRATDGPCLTCAKSGDTTNYEHVGTTVVWFPYAQWAWVAVHIHDGDLTFDALVERFNYGRGRMVSVTGSSRPRTLRLHDLRGQWLFVDQSDPDAEPWRFDFDEREPDSDLMDDPYFGIFRDTRRGAEFRCQMVSPVDMEKLNGCELHWNDEVLFSANIQDLGLYRIDAFRGELPPMISDPPGPQPEYHRGPDTVIGLRVEMPPTSQENGGDDPDS